MVTHILSILSSITLQNNTMFPQIFNSYLSYSYFWGFRCLIYHHLNNTNKPSLRSTQCIFLGYRSNHIFFFASLISLPKRSSFLVMLLLTNPFSPFVPRHETHSLTMNSLMLMITISSMILFDHFQTHSITPIFLLFLISFIICLRFMSLRSPHPLRQPLLSRRLPPVRLQEPLWLFFLLSLQSAFTPWILISKHIQKLNLHTNTTSLVRRKYSHDFRDPNWFKTMQDEYNALISNGT